MRQFLSRLFGRSSRAEAAATPQLWVFGKHHCWDDHIEDIPAPTELLSDLKSFLYVQAIAFQIENGNWEKLAGLGQIAPFDHMFYWSFRGQPVVGAIRGSRDGKGRDKYPLIVVIQMPGKSTPQTCLAWQEKAAAILQDLLRCESKEAFWARLQRGPGGDAAPDEPMPAPEARPTETPAAPPETAVVSVARFCYEVASRFPHWEEKSKLQGHSASRVRPADRQDDLFWLRAVDTLVAQRGDYLILKSSAGGWSDVLIGELTPDDFYGLRAGEAALPSSDSIPYQLAESDLACARQLLDLGGTAAIAC